MHRRAGLASVGIVAIFVLVLVGLTSPVSWTHPSTAGSSAPSGVGVQGPAIGSSAQVELAAASLRTGAGPAAVSASGAVGTWSNVTTKIGPGPSGRLAVMTWDAADGYVLLFGGVSVSCPGICVLRDTWTFLNGAWTNITTSVSGTPPALELSGMAFDPSTGKVILFGGEPLAGIPTAYTWSYSAKTWTNISATVGSTPPARVAAAMATDTTDGELVMTGGQTANGYNLDTWVFKGGTWTNVTSIAGSSGNLAIPTASNDPSEHGVLLFGPWAGNESRSATLVFSSGSWHNLTSTLAAAAPCLLLASAGYLSGSGAVVAYGGLLISAIGDVYVSVTWEFANGVWTNITDLTGAQPIAGIALGSAVDPNSNDLILFGGEDFVVGPEVSPYTYILSGPPQGTASVSKSVIDAGSPVTLTASVSGGLAPNTVSWNFGDGSANASGASLPHTYSSPGTFVATVTVTSLVGSTASASVSVFVNPDLSVVANVSSSPTVGSLTYFSADASGGTGPITYAWSFGDTSTSALADPSHTYASTGTYTATLKVTDSAGGNVTKTLSVVVGSVPSTSASLTSGTGLGLLVGIIVLVLIVLALAVMLMRKPKNPVMMAPASAPPTPYSPPSPPPPPPSG